MCLLSCSQSSPHYREKGGRVGPPACLLSLTQYNVMRGWRVGRTGLEKIMYNRRSNRGENEARRKTLRLFLVKRYFPPTQQMNWSAQKYPDHRSWDTPSNPGTAISALAGSGKRRNCGVFPSCFFWGGELWETSVRRRRPWEERRKMPRNRRCKTRKCLLSFVSFSMESCAKGGSQDCVQWSKRRHKSRAIKRKIYSKDYLHAHLTWIKKIKPGKCQVNYEQEQPASPS